MFICFCDIVVYVETCVSARTHIRIHTSTHARTHARTHRQSNVTHLKLHSCAEFKTSVIIKTQRNVLLPDADGEQVTP